MMDKLARLWRVPPRQAVGDSGSSGFELGGFTLHGDTRAGLQRPLRFSGSVPAWSYLVSWPNNWPIGYAMNRGLRVELDIDVLSGQIEVGLVSGDFASFVDRRALTGGRQTIVLEAPVATSAAALIVRTCSDGAASVEVHGLRGEATAMSKVRERGFLDKSVFDDLATRLAVSSNVVIVDVGANKGDTVSRFIDTFPRADIWALEPHPETFADLAQRFADDPRIRPRRLALSNHAGRSTMHSYTNAAINSLSPITPDAEKLIEGSVVASAAVEVEVQSLSRFCAAEGIEWIDILKLDTQGHEFDILHGEREFLCSGKVRFVLVELLFSPLYSSQAKAGEVIGLLEGCGFKLFDFYDFVYDRVSGLKWGDALLEFAPSR